MSAFISSFVREERSFGLICESSSSSVKRGRSLPFCKEIFSDFRSTCIGLTLFASLPSARMREPFWMPLASFFSLTPLKRSEKDMPFSFFGATRARGDDELFLLLPSKSITLHHLLES